MALPSKVKPVRIGSGTRLWRFIARRHPCTAANRLMARNVLGMNDSLALAIALYLYQAACRHPMDVEERR